MTTLLLSTTDKQLAMLKERQDTFGKDARKEIKRRKMVGFWDGTNRFTVNSDHITDESLEKEEAETIKKEIEEIGGKVELK